MKTKPTLEFGNVIKILTAGQADIHGWAVAIAIVNNGGYLIGLHRLNGGQVIGAVGVSGGQPHEDTQVARAGIAVLGL